MGNYPISVPAAAIMFVKQWTTLNIDDPELQRLTFKNRTFRSATDFFYPFGLKREPISDEIREARAGARRRLMARKRLREQAKNDPREDDYDR